MKFRELKLRRDSECPISGTQPTTAEPVGNPDEVTVQDMKTALDNPSLGIKVIDVREADTSHCGCVRGNAADPGE